ncbi:hypothetical protein ACWF9B_00590 [Streptomyces sp. NPDC055089]
MTEIIETSTDGRLRVCLIPDSDADSPRIACDRLTHVVTVLDRHYVDVDMDGGPLEDGWRQIKDRDKAVEIFTRWAQIAHGAEVIEDQPHDGPRTIWYLMPEGDRRSQRSEGSHPRRDRRVPGMGAERRLRLHHREGGEVEADPR